MRTVLAIAVLLVTAGCLGAPGTDSAEPTPADGFPPGVTEDGVENATELLDAHNAALAESGYAFRVDSETEQTENGTFDSALDNSTTTYTGRVAGTEFRLHVEGQSVDDNPTVDAWANNSVMLTRSEFGNQTRFNKGQRETNHNPWNTQLRSILDTGDFDVTERYVTDGKTFLVLRADELRTEHSDAYQTFDARAVVDLDGRVHELNATTTSESPSGTWTHTFNFELTEIGVEAVERPDWADRAESVVSASVSLDSTRDQVVLQHEAGDPLPEGTTVELTHDGETHTFTFDQTLDVGERAYVVYPADGGAPVLHFEEPSGEFERIQGDYEVSVTGPDGASILNAGFGVESATAEAPDN